MDREKLSTNTNTETPQTDLEGVEFDPDTAKKLREEAEQRKKERTVGAKVLSAAGFADRHKEIVASTYEKARATGQKMVGNNTDRRNDAYVARLESMIDRHGPRMEEKLWSMSSSSDSLTVKLENIPDSYWETQAQIQRDNGLDENISDYEKTILAKDLAARQSESIKNWSEYLGQKDSPYPMWFKLFAWDGVTKMSAIYDKGKQHFAKRDETTVAPYPHLNPAVLAQVYDAIRTANGLNESGESTTINMDEFAKKATKTYNFNKIYSLFLSRQTAAPEVPKNPDDVHGDWIEYKPGDEKALAEAAAGTPWCVASPAVGKNYLLTGKYGSEDIEETKSKAKFYLFHLSDGETGRLANSACASIRLDTNGNVAEISGIQDGQVLHDSLVPTVEKKVRTLPGGESFLKAFADKRELIKLDKKMQSGEDLSDTELRFIYEIDCPIHKVEMYGEDMRVIEIKQKYPIDKLIERRIVSARELKKRLAKDSEYVDDVISLLNAGIDARTIEEDASYGTQDIDALLEHGISHKDILTILGTKWAIENSDFVFSRGINASEIAKQIPTAELLDHLDFLDKNNVPYNLNLLMHTSMRQSGGSEILENTDAILSHGGKINFKKIARKVGPFDVINQAKTFCAHQHGDLVKKAIANIKKDEDLNSYYYTISSHLGDLLDGGVEIEDLSEVVNSPNRDTEQVLLNLDRLIEIGIDPVIDESKLIEHSADKLDTILDVVIQHPEKFNLAKVYEEMPEWAVAKCFDKLIENGIQIDVEKLAESTEPYFKILSREKFAKYDIEIDIDSCIADMPSQDACLLLNNHSKNNIVSKNAEKIARKIMTDETLDKSTRNRIKPLLWRMGLVK